ncbi:hypothetical protein RZS08_49285, partial [Arthrospira platensis SPKY1]|nr:hypothetical protein [Arthrospira platensis SPKY1]
LHTGILAHGGRASGEPVFLPACRRRPVQGVQHQEKKQAHRHLAALGGILDRGRGEGVQGPEQGGGETHKHGLVLCPADGQERAPQQPEKRQDRQQVEGQAGHMVPERI